MRRKAQNRAGWRENVDFTGTGLEGAGRRFWASERLSAGRRQGKRANRVVGRRQLVGGRSAMSENEGERAVPQRKNSFSRAVHSPFVGIAGSIFREMVGLTFDDWGARYEVSHHHPDLTLLCSDCWVEVDSMNKN